MTYDVSRFDVHGVGGDLRTGILVFIRMKHTSNLRACSATLKDVAFLVRACYSLMYEA